MSRRLLAELALLLVAATLLTILILALAETADTVTLQNTRFRRVVHRTQHVQRHRCLPVRQPAHRTIWGWEPWNRPLVIGNWLLFKRHAKTTEARCAPGGYTVRVWRWRSTWAAKCVRRHEGGYATDTGNGYHGAWQADTAFAAAYGPDWYVAHRGPYADRWPAWAQDTMAYRGWNARGWQPWPLSSQKCGLR